MAAPSIATNAQGTQTSDATSWSLTYPSGIAAGDLLLFMLCADGAVTCNAHDGGWVHSSFNANANAACLVFGKKIATGAEAGSFSIGITASEQGCWTTIRVIDWWGRNLGTNWANSDANGGVVPFMTQAQGNSTSPDNGLSTYNAIPGAEDVLWIVPCIADTGTVTVSGDPAGYTGVGSAQNNGNAAGTALRLVSKQSTSRTDDPGAFTLSGAVDWGTCEFAVRQAFNVTAPQGGRSQIDLSRAPYLEPWST